MPTLKVVLGSVVVAMAAVSGCSKESSSGGKPGITTAEQFYAEVIQSPIPVLVDFYADWCPPCRELAPVLERLEKEYAGRIKFVRVNVDQAKELAGEHRVEGIPTLELYRQGERVDSMRGFRTEDQLRPRLDKLLAGP